MKEKVGYLKKLSIPKVWNMVLLWLSFYLSKFLGKPIIWGMPTTLTIEPTTACNLGCPECPSGLKSFSRPTGNIATQTAEKVMADLKPSLSYVNFYFQGEPFIHKSFFQLVHLAHKNGIYSASSTNAHFLSKENAIKTIESGLDKLIISLDGTTQEVYQSYRVNGELSKVIAGTKTLLEERNTRKSKTPFIVFQFLVVKPNEHQISEARMLAKEIGVDDITFKTAQIYNYQNGSPLIPENEKYSRYKQLEDGTYAIKNQLDNQCWRMWRGSVMTWDGKVVPCCFDKDATHEMGNVQNLHFRDIWKSPVYNQFRMGVLKSRSEIDICKNCSEGTKVWN